MKNIFSENMRIKFNFKSLLGAKIGSWFEYGEGNKYIVEDVVAGTRYNLNTRVDNDKEVLVKVTQHTWNPLNNAPGIFSLFMAISHKNRVGYSYKCPNEALGFMHQANSVDVKPKTVIPPSKNSFFAKDNGPVLQPIIMMGSYAADYGGKYK